MICSIMQPTYLPWIGYFNLIKSADIFVFYDNVQFSKQSWQQRNKIRNKTGEILLTLTVNSPGDKGEIREKTIFQPDRILKKHLLSIKQNYSKSLNYDLYIEKIEEIYLKKTDSLLDLNTELIRLGCSIFQIQTPLIFSSELSVSEGKNEALISICKELKANKYLSPLGSKDYLKKELFIENNIQLFFQHYTHPHYNQLSYKSFISHLSFIDFLFNVPKENFKLWI
jgi:hypothetical protein